MQNHADDEKAAFYEKRRKWIDYICTRSGLSDRGFRVGFWLAKRMNGDDKCCWYTQKQIAKIMGMSHDKVLRAITELEDERVLVVVRNHRKANSYSIRMPYE